MSDAPNWRDDDAFRGDAGGGGGAIRAGSAATAPAAAAPTAPTAAADGVAPPTASTPPHAATPALPEPRTPTPTGSTDGAEDPTPLKVEIPRCAAQEDPDNETKQHTVYTIFCSKGKHGWMVQRRYTQFVQLHAQLGAVGLADQLPALPPKKLVGNMAADFVEQRRAALERYLQEVCTAADRLSAGLATTGGDDAAGRAAAALQPLYTFVGADWLLDDEAQDTVDGWVRCLRSVRREYPPPAMPQADRFRLLLAHALSLLGGQMYRTGVPKGGRATPPGDTRPGDAGAEDESCQIL